MKPRWKEEGLPTPSAPPETELQHSAGWGELARWSTQEEEMVGVSVRDGQMEEGQVAEEDPDGRGGEDR